MIAQQFFKFDTSQVHQLKDNLGHFDGFDTTINYSTVKSAGPAASPLEFPTPTVGKGCRMTARALDHRTGRIHNLNNILICIGPDEPEEAYLIQKRIGKSVYGAVRQCVVLKRRRKGEGSCGTLSDEDDKEVEWISTDRLVAVKVSDESNHWNVLS